MPIAALGDRLRASTRSTLAFLISAIAAATLMGAWFFQYVIKLEPCPLCLQQRIPYYFAIPFALALGFIARGNDRSPLVVYGLYAVAALMAGSAMFGVYHSGVEWLVARTNNLRGRSRRRSRRRQHDRCTQGQPCGTL
jgi:disulfide bond formation protein DsbB